MKTRIYAAPAVKGLTVPLYCWIVWVYVRLGVVISRPKRRGRRAGGLKQTRLAATAAMLADTTNIQCIPVHISTRCVELQINKRGGINENNLIKLACNRQELTNDKSISTWTCLLHVLGQPRIKHPWLLTLLQILAEKKTDSTQSYTVFGMNPSGYKFLQVPHSRGKCGGVGILYI